MNKNIMIFLVLILFIIFLFLSYFGNICPSVPLIEKYFFDQQELKQFSNINEFNISKVNIIAYFTTRSKFPCAIYKIKKKKNLVMVNEKSFNDFLHNYNSNCQDCLVYQSLGVFGGGFIQWYSSGKYICNSTKDIRILRAYNLTNNLSSDCSDIRGI